MQNASLQLIGLTGGIGSGKSTITNWFKQKGIPVMDADAIAHSLVYPGSPAWQAILVQFGQSILNPNHSLNRQKLASLVFSSPKAKKQLEHILHPLIQQEMLRQAILLKQKGHSIILYSAPLIFEANLQHLFDAVILVTCTTKQQIERICKRDGLSQQEAIARIESQMPLSEKKKHTPYQIDNSGSLAETKQQLERLWLQLQKKNDGIVP